MKDPRLRRVRRQLARLDRQLLGWSVRSRHPHADRALTMLSGAANNAKLWYAVAALLALTGRRRPRGAAAAGLLGMGMASAAVNGPLKFAWQRDRPAAEVLGLSESLLPLPRTYSFPSGHSASAFAFATGVSLTLPPAAPAVLPLAGAVAYSRVHTGVHFPSDVLAGAAIGSAAGLGAAAIVRRVQSPSRHRPQAPVLDVPVPRDVVLVTSKKAGTAGDLNGAKATLDAVGFRITDEVDVRDALRLSDLLAAAGDDTPLVVAAGGDGTVGAAAGAVLGTSALLSILPLGTANDVACSLGIARDARDAAEALASGVVCAVDAGRVQRPGEPDRTFVHAATAGLNVQFAKFASASALRDRFGALTYPVSAALALRRYQPFECTIERDDGESDTFPVVHVSVSNATVFGGPLGMRVPRADITDGKLDVLAIGPLTAVGLSLATANTVVGRHSPVRRVRTYQARSLRIAAQGRHDLAADGEVVGELPAQFRVLPGALRVVVPAVA